MTEPATATLPVCSRCGRKIITFDGSRPTICGNCQPPPAAVRCGCPMNEAGDIKCHVCGERVNVRCWKCKTPRGEGPCPQPRPGATMKHFEIVVGTNQPITNTQARDLLIAFIKAAEQMGVSVGGEWRVLTDA